jgi:hypothetical protein
LSRQSAKFGSQSLNLQAKQDSQNILDEVSERQQEQRRSSQQQPNLAERHQNLNHKKFGPCFLPEAAAESNVEDGGHILNATSLTRQFRRIANPELCTCLAASGFFSRWNYLELAPKA